MRHIVLLGDSIFDNAAYVDGGPAVIDQLRRILAPEWKATLLAVDGATMADVPAQVRAIPADATHLVVSMGGNDALLRADILEMPVKSTADALRALSKIVAEFEASYRKALTACLRTNIPAHRLHHLQRQFSGRGLSRPSQHRARDVQRCDRAREPRKALSSDRAEGRLHDA